MGLSEDKIMGRIVCWENQHLVARIFLQKEEAGSFPEIGKWNGLRTVAEKVVQDRCKHVEWSKGSAKIGNMNLQHCKLVPICNIA